MIDMDMSGKMRITLLIYLDHGVEQLVYTLSSAAHSRHYRHAEQISQLSDVQSISFCLQFVIHIQSHNHPQVHVDQLGSKVEVALKIGCINDIDHHIRNLLKKIFADIKFLRAVCGKGICAGQIHQLESISPMLKQPLLGIHGHATVVAHMLMSA